MIVAKCPLRISLVGGSTDLQSYLDKYETGGVVSFPTNLYTYISLKLRKDNKYRVVYSHIEEVDATETDKIKNDVVREALKFRLVPPCDIIFASDIPSAGSGLASSTSYMIAMLKAIDVQCGGNELSQYELCVLAHRLEKQFNPMVGYQDPYGCGIGGLKRINFAKDGTVTFQLLPSDALGKMWMYLVPTNVSRSSTRVLETLDFEKVHNLVPFVDSMTKHIHSEYMITNLINLSWQKKKETSPNILTPALEKQEQELLRLENVKSVRLCGAGGGGYFFVLAGDRIPKSSMDQFLIKIDNVGVTSRTI